MYGSDKIIGTTIIYSMYLRIYVKGLENRTPVVRTDCYWVLLTRYYKKLRKRADRFERKMEREKIKFRHSKTLQVWKRHRLFTSKW